jgi:hypothetical protein
LSCAGSKNIDDWRKIGKGELTVQDGVLRQSAIAPNVTAFVVDPAWIDYTITLKARKLSGENGFQIYFHNRNDGKRIRWDLGGYNDSVHVMSFAWQLPIGALAPAVERSPVVL